MNPQSPQATSPLAVAQAVAGRERSTDSNVDPLQEALSEAEHLMEELGVDDVTFNEFAIDSDDDDDFGEFRKTGSRSTGASPSDNAKKNSTSDKGAAGNGTAVPVRHSIDLHPLADDFLQTTTPTPQSSQDHQPAHMHPLSDAAAPGAGPASSFLGSMSAFAASAMQPHPPVAANAYSGPVSANLNPWHMTTPIPPHGQQQALQPPPYGTMPLQSQPQPTVLAQQLPQHQVPYPITTTSSNAPALDALRFHSSRFASNLANIAQRAASQMANAAVVTSPAGMSGSSTTSGGMPTPALSTSFSGQSPSTVYGGLQQPSMSSNTYSASFSGMQQPQQALVPVELDNEQKMALVYAHVGELLPGERVIMFLSNLLHVSDSTGFQYNYNSTTPNGMMWCCVMTYYRLVLFSTSASMAEPRPADWNAACWPSPELSQPSLLQMPLASMDRVEKSVFTSSSSTFSPAPGGSGNPTTLMGLLIQGKDNGRQLRLTTPNYADTLRAHEALLTYAFPGRRNLGYLFAFESKRHQVMDSLVTDELGKKTVTLPPVRKRFDAVQEFTRQMHRHHRGPAGQSINIHGHHPNNSQLNRPWKIWTQINHNYQVCLTYPNVLVGPASLDESHPDGQRIIRQCASFRSENRLPALTWTSGIDGASIWRCSQPKIGLQGNRSSADELFLKHILESAAAASAMTATINHSNSSSGLTSSSDSSLLSMSTSPLVLSRAALIQLTGSSEVQNWIPEPSCGLKILDMRPRSAAMANRTSGYGYENTSNYPGTTLQFCNIGNIHAVRDAYQKISNLCLSMTTADVQWHSLVEDTKWLSSIRLILAASWEAAFWVHVHRMPVVLHCSHGWDRTSQVAVLSQLFLDPHYRTRSGFATLIEKDFMSFGHPFSTRCAHGECRGGNGGGGGDNSGPGVSPSPPVDEGQISPIFVQLLDCVYQLAHQYPECFEFNTKYLLLISEYFYSCRFGNFLCDSERDREMVAIRQRTHSIWDYLESRSDTVSPMYSPQRSAGVMLMPLSTLLRNVTLWTDRHCRHGPKPTLRWLPLDVSRPRVVQDHDEQGPLCTAQENGYLMATTITTTTTNTTAASGTTTTGAGTVTSQSSPVASSEVLAPSSTTTTTTTLPQSPSKSTLKPLEDAGTTTTTTTTAMTMTPFNNSNNINITTSTTRPTAAAGRGGEVEESVTMLLMSSNHNDPLPHNDDDNHNHHHYHQPDGTAAGIVASTTSTPASS